MHRFKIFRADYRQHTKGLCLEEPFDYLIFRPLAYLFVKLSYALPLTPNLFSFAALLVAFMGSCAMSTGSSQGFMLGGVAILIFSVLDCCDGMLARMKGNGSKYGELVDMLVDLLSNLALFSAFIWALIKRSEAWYTPYLAFASGICLLLHASIYNFYKKQYFFYLAGRPDGLREQVLALESQYWELKQRSGPVWERGILKLFLSFASCQLSGQKKVVFYDRDQYLKCHRSTLGFWGLIAGSTHLTLLALSLILQMIEFYFIYALIFANLSLLAINFRQAQVNQKLSLMTWP